MKQQDNFNYAKYKSKIKRDAIIEIALYGLAFSILGGLFAWFIIQLV